MRARAKIRVGIIGYKSNPDFHGYELHAFEPEAYFARRQLSLRRLALGGIREFHRSGLLYTADGLDRMYREKDPEYMRMTRDFVDKFHRFDLLIISRFNPIHPEILHHELSHPTKVMGFIDDPGASYTRGVPYLWAFDGAFHISPSYDETRSFPQMLQNWGCHQNHWWPLSARHIEAQHGDEFYARRNRELVYVGASYGDKTDKLKVLKKHFGDRFLLYGRWPLGGYYGYVRGLSGRPFFFYRVKSISNQERDAIYKDCKIGFNMHLSGTPRETGNMRMYEIPAYGMMQVCDKAGCDSHNKIFKDGIEAVYYDDIQDAIDKIEHYLGHDEDRIRIAHAGHQRVRKDFWWEDQLKGALDWALQIREQSRRASG